MTHQLPPSIKFRFMDDLFKNLSEVGFRQEILEIKRVSYENLAWAKRSSCRIGLDIFGGYFEYLLPYHMESVDKWLYGCGFDPTKIPSELRNTDFPQLERAVFDYLIQKLPKNDGSVQVFEEAVYRGVVESGQDYRIPGYPPGKTVYAIDMRSISGEYFVPRIDNMGLSESEILTSDSWGVFLGNGVHPDDIYLFEERWWNTDDE
jgi:hypothetical protein